MEDMRLDILGVRETRWTGSGIIQRENHDMIYTGGESHARESRKRSGYNHGKEYSKEQQRILDRIRQNYSFKTSGQAFFTSTLFNVMHQQATVLQKKLRLSMNY